MLASTRWRPHSSVGDAFGTGVPGAEAIRSTCAPPAREQRPVKAPLLCTNVVDAPGHWSPSSEIPAAINVPGATGCVGAPVVSGTDRLLPRAAGFVQAVSSFEPSGSPRKPATPLAPRPNTDAAGGVSLKMLNGMTEEGCVARLPVGSD